MVEVRVLNKQRKVRKELKERYYFRQMLTANMVQMFLAGLEESSIPVVAASLTAGVVRLEAVIYWEKERNNLGYDLMVKDSPESLEWICYESLPDEVRFNVWNLEREMFRVLDRAVEQYGLSYTGCTFPSLVPGVGKPKEPP